MQEGLRQTTGVQQSGTRYVFAGTQAHDEDTADTKVCPRCGALLFADMDVCYGCLYDFARDKQGRAYGGQVRAGRMRAAPSLPGAGSTGGMSRSDPLEGIELDEIDDDLDLLVDAGATQKGQPVVPRHSKERAHAADSTLDLSTLNAASVEVETKGAFQIIARSSEMQVRIPLPEGGLTIGRGEGNDVILSSRSVSRQHLRMMPLVDTVLVEDCGATNPATIDDVALEGTAQLAPGQTVVVCGTEFEVEADRG